MSVAGLADSPYSGVTEKDSRTRAASTPLIHHRSSGLTKYSRLSKTNISHPCITQPHSISAVRANCTVTCSSPGSSAVISHLSCEQSIRLSGHPLCGCTCESDVCAALAVAIPRAIATAASAAWTLARCRFLVELSFCISPSDFSDFDPPVRVDVDGTLLAQFVNCASRAFSYPGDDRAQACAETFWACRPFGPRSMSNVTA